MGAGCFPRGVFAHMRRSHARFFYVCCMVAMASVGGTPVLADDASAAGATAPATATQAADPASGAERAPDRFMVAAYDVSGVTRLTVDEVERLVYPHEGPDRTPCG